MCGIAGLYSKSSATERQLGGLLADMMMQLSDRGPDSSGFALYRNPVAAAGVKLSLLAPEEPVRWGDLTSDLAAAFSGAELLVDYGDQAVVRVDGAAGAVLEWIASEHPEVSVIGSGSVIEVHKKVGRPELVIDSCDLRTAAATHALGHTRMATESRITTAGSHPFSTGADLCLVHNGSLSNHNSVRRDLIRHGLKFATENDSEVAAGYLMWRMAEGDTLDRALERSLDELDGFFTFAVGTAGGFAVLRDPIACKPAVMAETDDWVAMASEYRAIAVLPGAEDAELWEPDPGRIYSWSREQVTA